MVAAVDTLSSDDDNQILDAIFAEFGDKNIYFF